MSGSLSLGTRDPMAIVEKVCEVLNATEDGRALALLLRTEVRNLINERDLWAKEAHELVGRFVKRQ